jgi:hypothetical protein
MPTSADKSYRPSNPVYPGPSATPLSKQAGVKQDSGKLRWDLLPIGPVREIVKVFHLAITDAKKPKPYEPHSWQKVPEARTRYYSALMRHVTDWWEGKLYDEEGTYSLANAGACLLILLWHDMKGSSGEDQG